SAMWRRRSCRPSAICWRSRPSCRRTGTRTTSPPKTTDSPRMRRSTASCSCSRRSARWLPPQPCRLARKSPLPSRSLIHWQRTCSDTCPR
ncbi:hypothetical protein LTS01_026114, partial [Friedmanniomyces endolithicus]